MALAANKSCHLSNETWENTAYGCIINSDVTFNDAVWFLPGIEGGYPCVRWNSAGTSGWGGTSGYAPLCRMDDPSLACNCSLGTVTQKGQHTEFVQDDCGMCGGNVTNCGNLLPAFSTEAVTTTTTEEITTTTTEEATTTTTEEATTTEAPLEESESYVIQFQVDITLDTNTCGETLALNGGEAALKETVSELTGVHVHNIRNVSIVGGDCGRRFLQASSSTYGKYALRYVILANSSSRVTEIEQEMSTSVKQSGSETKSRDVTEHM